MATGFLSPIGTPTQQWFSDQGVVLAGGLITTYLAGTTTPAPTFTGPNLAIANPNPIVLDSAGRCPQEVWLQSSTQYKFVITDKNSNPLSVGTFDNISGINDTGGGGGGGITSEWIVSTLTPTFVDATHFTVPGNQTTTFTVNRRVYATVTAGTIYGTITASSFGANTSVTVLWDSGALDSGLSSVAYALLNSVNPSIPVNEPIYKGLLAIQVITATGPLVTTKGANRARLRMCGGAGAGGGTPGTSGTLASAGGGGSSGSYLELFVSSAWQTYNGTTITIGTGGVGAGGAGGGNGTSTTFGAFATAPGGQGAPVAVTQNTGQVTGLMATGAIGLQSLAPTSSLTILSTQFGGLGIIGILTGTLGAFYPGAGVGGSNPLGTGGAGAPPSANAAGTAGSGYGSGGGGAYSTNTATTFAGGNGAPGVMIIEEYL